MISENGKSAPARLIFDSIDGTISGWNPEVDPTHAIVMVDNGAAGDAYTGLDMAQNSQGQNVLYAADFTQNRVEMFNGDFKAIGSFTDPTVTSIEPSFGAWSVQAVNGKLYVTFASLANTHGGVVDVFDTDGHLLTPNHFAANAFDAGPLENPWGIVQAPANFGAYSNDLLIGNVAGAGNINVFNPATGAYLGELDQPDGTPIAITGLWDLEFGDGTPHGGKTNQLFFDAGPNAPGVSINGLFGVIRPAGHQGGKGGGDHVPRGGGPIAARAASWPPRMKHRASDEARPDSEAGPLRRALMLTQARAGPFSGPGTSEVRAPRPGNRASHRITTYRRASHSREETSMASRRRLEERFAFASHAVHHHRRRRRPVLEVLEGRALLATFTVNSLGDAGSGSGDSGDLRYCINQANANDQANTIVFDSTVFSTPQTITLSGGQLELKDTGGTQTITGPAAGVTISGGGNEPRLSGRPWCDRLDLRPDHLRRLEPRRRQWRRSGELRHGDAHRLHLEQYRQPRRYYGGGVFNSGTGNLTLTDCTVSGSLRPAACSIPARPT